MKSENISFQPKHVLLYFSTQYRHTYLITVMQQNSQNFNTSASELQKVNRFKRISLISHLSSCNLCSKSRIGPEDSASAASSLTISSAVLKSSLTSAFNTRWEK